MSTSGMPRSLHTDGVRHKQPLAKLEYPLNVALQRELEPEVWGPDATSTLSADEDPVGDPRCLRFSWNGSIENVSGYSGFSRFWVNYWWKDELDPYNFGNWMSFRNQLAGGSRYSSWTGSEDDDEGDEADPGSNQTFAAFEAWWSEKHSVFQWRRVVNILNSAPALPALTGLELFLDPEFPNELIADYGRAGVETAEAAREFRRRGRCTGVHRCNERALGPRSQAPVK